MLCKNEDAIDGMGPIKSRAAVAELLPKLVSLMSDHVRYVAAPLGSREETAMKRRRAQALRAMDVDERAMADILVASLSVITDRPLAKSKS